MCFCSEKVRLPAVETPPEPLLSYMSGTTSESKQFLKNIRRYNSCFQMTSFGTSSIVGRRGFETTFKVQGQIYQKAGSLLPLPSENAKFLQTYFICDEEREINQRCDNTSGVRRDIVLNLQRMFHENNQLIKTFKTALEDMLSAECKVVIRDDRRPVGEHERRFNNPQINEVAIIIAGSDCDRRDIESFRNEVARYNALQRQTALMMPSNIPLYFGNAKMDIISMSCSVFPTCSPQVPRKCQ
ncbi:hypothetical protein AVEN_29318-1 [Araneus ventricosus]|uniref:Helitron helicase-like domain-containing protein n=1 Tax=Araneus ventricosus TaxID=182803 RepID=A0A4Y2J032_ARAVE|nr:hypothetical protein AVEN_29318-1 [Araneus ventricosus]